MVFVEVSLRTLDAEIARLETMEAQDDLPAGKSIKRVQRRAAAKALRWVRGHDISGLAVLHAQPVPKAPSELFA